MLGPRISVVVATRDRPTQLVTCLDSLAALAPPADEIVVVDQSTDERTRAAVAASALPRVRYVHQEAVGLSHGRNLGVASTSGELVIFTDDDCVVDRGLVGALTATLARHPDAAVLFGRVDAGPHDPRLGLVPCFPCEAELVVRSGLERSRLGGMGACMVVRRSVLVALGGFDVWLGVGAPFAAAEETDLAARALAVGHAIVEAPALRVTHHGFRTWAEHEALCERYLFGTGAMYGKQARLWPGVTAVLSSRMAVRWAVGSPRLRYLREPRRWLRLRAFARGWWRGLRTPVDRGTACFVPPDP